MVLRPVRRRKKKHTTPMSPPSTCIFLFMLKHWKSHQMTNVCLRSLRSGWAGDNIVAPWCVRVPNLTAHYHPPRSLLALVRLWVSFLLFFMNEARYCWLSHVSLAVPCTNGTIQHDLKYAARNTSGPGGRGGGFTHHNKQDGHRRCFRCCFLKVVMYIMH